MTHLERVDRARRRALALGGQGPGRRQRRVGRRDHQRGREQGHRLAFASGVGRRHGGLGQFLDRCAAAEHAGRRCISSTRRRRDAPVRWLATLFGREPSQTIREDLRRLKQLLEAGEIPASAPPSTAGSSSDEGRLLLRQGRRPRRDGSRPAILNPRDAIVRVTATAICGSDLHIYGGYIPTMENGRRARPRVHGRGRRGRAATTTD